MSDLDTYANIIISLVDPDLYELARTALVELRKGNHSQVWCHKWTSVFTAVCVVANRVTPPHKDTKGAFRLLDTLINTGTSTKTFVCLRELKARFAYNPGTAILFAGRLFVHEVPPWTTGERVCYAYFMREEVLRRFCTPEELKRVGWNTTHAIIS